MLKVGFVGDGIAFVFVTGVAKDATSFVQAVQGTVLLLYHDSLDFTMVSCPFGGAVANLSRTLARGYRECTLHMIVDKNV